MSRYEILNKNTYYELEQLKNAISCVFDIVISDIKIDLTGHDDGEIGTRYRAEECFTDWCEVRWQNVKTFVDDRKHITGLRENHFYLLVLLYLFAEEQNILDILQLMICDNAITEDNITILKEYFADDFLNVKLEAIEPSSMFCALSESVTLEMVKVKAGFFMMGSPEDEAGRFDNENLHMVTLTRDYYLGKFPVTQAQWKTVRSSYCPYPFCKDRNRPIVYVSWDAAKEFCDKLNEKYAGELPAGYRFDLPTEAQWEYACRAGTTTSLNSGENMRILGENYSPNLNEVGWYGGNCGQDFNIKDGVEIVSFKEKQYSDSLGGTHPVGQKQGNNWGLYDMHGNVAEWCLDWYNEDYGGDATDPMGPADGEDRVCRGGGWNCIARGNRSACRYYQKPYEARIQNGFRLAVVPVQ